MKTALFTYGTLEIPAVMHTITERYFENCKATLSNYARYKLKKGNYPGIISETAAEVRGTVYFDIDDASLRKLDRYEDFCYQREIVEVISDDNDILQVMAYVIPQGKSQSLSEEHWDKENFIAHELESFLRSITVSQ